MHCTVGTVNQITVNFIKCLGELSLENISGAAWGHFTTQISGKFDDAMEAAVLMKKWNRIKCYA